ncbi:unnamed protein product [Prorocentrum cordatum]|uniref:K Homology domain-containing protein n=1 Tax=Prorocentrum cordatum TaxID=2364126 RepID=A0ABN9YF53_9DINO|nr:unnamed protein product [Polarella glacialis]CAK0911464.1 unnamed protein product [Polarella glacialis]
MTAEESEMSKSAKRRAAKKARDAAAEEPAKPPEPEVKKAEPAPKAKGKAKAKAEPAPAAAEPTPKAKGKAKAAPKAAAEPAPAAPKAAAEPKPKADAKKKADGKAAAKPKAKAKKEDEEPAAPAAPPAKTNDFTYTFVDDGKGGDWEVSTGMNAKRAKQQKKLEERKILEAQVLKTAGGKAVPGAAAAMNMVPGMAGYKAGPTVDQSLMATPEQIAKIMATKAPAAEEKPKEAVSVAEVKVPEDRVGIVIGPKGATLNMVKEKTDVKSIQLPAGGILRIEGKPENVAQAQQAFEELVAKGFTSLSYENFKSDAVKVPTNALPDLIGKEGCIIRAVKDALKVEITMPKSSGPPGSGPKRTMVTIAGKGENVEKAKEVINDIVMYYHHEITHPGDVHEELEIEEWNYRFIIGKAGSELRHTEKNYKVRVRIPRDETPNRNVVVVGEKRNVERAVAYIHNVIAKAAEPRGRGAGDKAEDFWGEEDDISGDPELSRYLYKRS